MRAHDVVPVAFWLVQWSVGYTCGNGMREARISSWVFEKTVIEGIAFDHTATAVARPDSCLVRTFVEADARGCAAADTESR